MNKSHEVDYKLYGDDMQFVEIELDPNESVLAETGAMMTKGMSNPLGELSGLADLFGRD